MEKVKQFISTFMIAVSNCSLYSKDHASINELAKKTHSILGSMPEDRFEIMVIENDLIINRKPCREAGIHGFNLIKRLKRKGISRVDFLRGVTSSDIRTFIIDIAEPGAEIRACPYIRTGAVYVRMPGANPGAACEFDQTPLSPSKGIETVADVFQSTSPFKKLQIAGLDEVVVNFVATFKRESNILKLLSPVKSFSEYTYTHATNVAVLSMSQAKSFGINDMQLHEIGIAALLHDVGKLFISKDILEKDGSLDEREYAEIKNHSLYGARYLAKTDNLPRLASVIAFEHHLKYDGSGYPRTELYCKKKQHICSQIVAVSDFFDALRSRRPYRESIDKKEIFTLMKKNAGKDFNPFLVDNFIRLVGKSAAV